MTADIAIDIGAASMLAFVTGRGVVLNEPTLVALERSSADVVAVGRESWKAAASNPETVTATWPFRQTPVSDYSITEKILDFVLKRAGSGRLARPRLLLAVPTGATEVERRAVEEAAIAAGAREVWMIEAPMAAAIGAELPIMEPHGSCVVVAGGASTAVAVISMGGMVASRSVRAGGFDMDDGVQRLLRREYGMSVGERTAEGIKTQVGSASPLDEELKAEIRGRELETGAPKTVIVTSEEIRDALEDSVRAMIDTIRAVLGDTPPELAHDVLDGGIALCGGAGCLRGLGERFNSETAIPVRIVDRPVEVVCLGAGRALDRFDEMVKTGIVTKRGS